MINMTIDSFGINSNTIKSTFDLWISNYLNAENIIFESNENKLYKAFKEIKFNDVDSINKLSHAVFGCTLEDWNISKRELFFKTLSNLILKVENDNSDLNKIIVIKEYIDESKISHIGKTLYSNLTESIEEYGSALSNEEKVLILKKMISDIID